MIAARGGLARMTRAQLDKTGPALLGEGLAAVRQTCIEKIRDFVRSAGKA